MLASAGPCSACSLNPALGLAQQLPARDPAPSLELRDEGFRRHQRANLVRLAKVSDIFRTNQFAVGRSGRKRQATVGPGDAAHCALAGGMTIICTGYRVIDPSNTEDQKLPACVNRLC